MPAPLTKNKDKPKRVKHKRTISDGLAKSPLSTVPLPAAVVPTTKISPTAFRCIGSYSWATGEKNTIVVPGCPVILQTTTLPLQLKRRSHKHFVDQNGHRVPSCPLLPIFLAVPTTFDWSLVHVVAERNSLRKLLGWVQGRKKAFKIDLELVGETVLLYRWSEKTRVTIPNNDFGAAFEEAVTRPADGSPIPTHGHYRIVEYCLGGVRLVVRCEEDSCIGPTTGKALQTTTSTVQAPPLTPHARPRTHAAERLVSVVQWGTADPSLKTVELKVSGQAGPWKGYYEQMFFGQTSEVVVGVHKNGVVDRVVSKTLEDMEEQDDALQPALGQLVATLRWIQALVKGNRAFKLSLVCSGYEIKVFERFEGPGLPQRYKHLFTRR